MDHCGNRCNLVQHDTHPDVATQSHGVATRHALCPGKGHACACLFASSYPLPGHACKMTHFLQHVGWCFSRSRTFYGPMHVDIKNCFCTQNQGSMIVGIDASSCKMTPRHSNPIGEASCHALRSGNGHAQACLFTINYPLPGHTCKMAYFLQHYGWCFSRSHTFYRPIHVDITSFFFTKNQGVFLGVINFTDQHTLLSKIAFAHTIRGGPLWQLVQHHAT